MKNKKLIEALRAQTLQSIEYYMKKYKVTYEEVKEAYDIALKLNLKEQQQ